MNHHWGYSPASLAQVMHEAGLLNLRQEPAQFKLREPRVQIPLGAPLYP